MNLSKAKFLAASAASIAMSASTLAAAVVLDFNSQVTVPTSGIAVGPVIIEDGFKIASPFSFYAFQDGWSSGRGSSNGTTTLGTNIIFSGSFLPVFTLTAVDNSLFNLSSVDLGEQVKVRDFEFPAVARTYRFVGTVINNLQVTYDFSIDLLSVGTGALTDFQTVTLPSNFTGLTSVAMSAFTSSNIFGTNTNFDNIVVTATPPGLTVPEPTSIALFGLGLLGLISHRRSII